MTIWNILLWCGVALTAAGLAGIAWCILAVIRARRAGLPDAAMRLRMQRVVAVNMGALAASMLGLMAVAVSIMLGR